MVTHRQPRCQNSDDRQPTTDLCLPTTGPARSCARCMYANRVECPSLAGAPGDDPCVLICVNTTEAPGEMREVAPAGLCPRFCARREERSPRLTPPEPPNGQVRYIALTKRKFALVDVGNYERLNRHRWFAMKGDRTFYAIRNDEGGTVLMHREILNAPKGVSVDHIDGYGLNNCASNLRLCTPGQNNCNRGPHRRGSSRFRGVCWHKQARKWAAAICFRGVHYHLGLFDDEVEAARVRDRKAVELHGEFAWLNFPDDYPARKPSPR